MSAGGDEHVHVHEHAGLGGGRGLGGSRSGFTLIEVMVAVAILGLGLASLFTSQVGAIKVAQRARSTTVATLLARCKMAEVEERVLRDGLPYDDLSESDECCEDLEHEGYECDWSVRRIVLPDQSLDDDGTGDGLLDALGTGAGDDEGDEDAVDVRNLDPNDLSPETMSGVLGGSMGAGGALDMVTQMAFPIMKPIIEDQVRRAQVTVRWFEGNKEHSFDVVQFLVSEQGAAVPAGQQGTTTGGTGASTATGGTGTGTATGTGGVSGGTT